MKKKEKAQSIHVAVGKQHGGESVAVANSVFKKFIGKNNLIDTSDTGISFGWNTQFETYSQTRLQAYVKKT